ncbi:mRNA cap guanine-N7 methyltransferase-like isoform X1, partial [Leptotrombidium deliense]
DNLRKGGYFIATTVNAFEVIKRLRESDSNSFGNDVYSVTFSDDFKDLKRIPLFGAKYNFHLEGVVDCPEFLVYFPVLQEIAKEYNLKLIYLKPFEEYFQENCHKREAKGLLNKMSALETYPAFRGKSLVGNEEDYFHASDYIDLLKADSIREPINIGTLSSSEWEAISLYLVFSFVKM